MSLQIRRGTAAQLSNITPVIGELIYTTDSNQVYVGDGTTPGGIPVAVGGGGTLTGVNVIASANVSAGGNVYAGNISASGSIVGNSLSVGTTVSATGNIRGGNFNTTGNITATGNVFGGAFIGNGSQLTGIISSYSNANVASYMASGNSLSISITGNVSATGNITGAYHFGNGYFLSGITSYANALVASWLASGNAAPISTIGTVTTTANITGGNLLTGGLTSSAGNIYSGGKIYAAGNLECGGNVSAGFISGSSISITGNLAAGNINSTKSLSVYGNVYSSYFFGNTNTTTTTAITANIGTGNFVNISVSGGIQAGNIQATSSDIGSMVTDTVSATGDILAGGIISVAGNIIIGGEATVDVLVTGNISASGDVYTDGNVSAGNIVTIGSYSSGGNIISGTYISALGNVYGNLHLGNVFSASGNVRGGNLTTAGILTVNSGNAITAIVNGGGSAVGNIGSEVKPFNTVFAVASTALYADLAERYLGDAAYEPGTVVSFGGNQEVTMTVVDSDPRVAGVVSTNPAYDMNSGLSGEHVTAVALMGRVPCHVEGTVTKGALMVAAGNGRARAESAPAVGTVIGKALEDFAGEIGTIEIVVGRV
jgi:hypothetical protein